MDGEPARSYEEEAAALYAVPPAQFTLARDVRVAELRGAHHAVLAGRLKLLRRPTVAAWCINVLAATHPVELRALVDLGAELADAQRRADPATIRTLSAQRRAQVADLIAAASRAAGDKLEATTVATIEATLNAAVADASVADRVLSGQLVRGESYAGFGPLPAADPATGPQRAPHRSGSDRGVSDRGVSDRGVSDGGVSDGGVSDGGGSLAGGSDRGASDRGASARAASIRAEADAAAARCRRDDARRARDVARHAREEAGAVLAEAERRLAVADRDLAAADRGLDRAERDRQRAAERLDALF